MATLTTAGPTGTHGRIPWYLWCATLAVTSVTIGAHWDVSWHRSIGRDTFWTPAHLAIYLCGILAGIYASYLILFTTFQRPPQMVAMLSAKLTDSKLPTQQRLQIVDVLAPARLIGREHMIEGAILAHDHDDMLDGALRLVVVAIGTTQMGGFGCAGGVTANQRQNCRGDNGAIA